MPAVPWINYLRVPVALSGLLLLIWFPLIFRLPRRFPATTTLPLSPFLWHWLAVTGALFLLSAAALAVRLRVHHGRPGRRKSAGQVREPASPPVSATADHLGQPGMPGSDPGAQEGLSGGEAGQRRARTSGWRRHPRRPRAAARYRSTSMALVPTARVTTTRLKVVVRPVQMFRPVTLADVIPSWLSV